MTEQRSIEVAAEVSGTPEQVWEAIATGPGITAWFMPAEVDGRVGGSVVLHHDEDESSSGRITAYDPPHRFAYAESGEGFVPDGAHTLATEFLVEARGGGGCVVRIVMSGFGEGDAWDRAIESFTGGWQQALTSLRLYLEHFRGEPVASVNAGEMVRAAEGMWASLAGVLGLPSEPQPGDRIATAGPDTPALGGTVEDVGDGIVTLVLDEPARGIGLIGVGGPGGDELFVTVRAQFFGPDAAPVAARQQDAWKAWLSGWAHTHA